jgi:ribosome biogenesis GTPase
VTSLNRDFNPRRIERYLALAWDSGAIPIVVLNKADLCADHETWRAAIAPVTRGVSVVVTSAVRGDGMAELRDIIRTGGTTALLGSSGVGKSTLINALVGDSRQKVLPVRDHDDRGRHSTTARQLFCLPDGGLLIDTPGMRELQLWTDDDALGRPFKDIEDLAASCRFADCSHEQEPGCAVRAAVAEGTLDQGRLESFLKLRKEIRFLATKKDVKTRRQHEKAAGRRFASMLKEVKKNKPRYK